MRLPLFDAHPVLQRAHPVAGLLAGPTPVEPLPGHEGVYVKRDDLTATDYGGNKVRKLDFLLAQAKARERTSVVAFGYAGSNFVAATAWHGRKLGLHTIAGLLPQVPADYIVDNLSVALASGAELFVRSNEPALAGEAALRSVSTWLADGMPPMWIPPGGSSAAGSLGFVNAAFELATQVEAGELPAPDAIVLPFSSMGTVAGLAAGLRMAGLKSRIVAVQVVDQRHAGRAKLIKLLDRLCRLLRSSAVSLPEAAELAERVAIRSEFFGGEYARADERTTAAMHRFAAATGARADSAYCGKALACLYADLDAGHRPRPALYWHTLSRSALPAGVARAAPGRAPPALRRYWSG